MKLFLPFIFIIYFILNDAYAQDFSEGTSKDLANQCFKSHQFNAQGFGRTLNNQYSHEKALKMNDTMVSYKITAFVSITFTDNYNEEHKASCFFNSKAQVACFGNPYNLESNKNTKVIDCWDKTIRF